MPCWLQRGILTCLAAFLVTAPAAAAVTKVRVMTGANASEYDVVQQIARKWNSTHPDIQVEVEMAAGSEQVLQVAILGGAPPDLFTAMASGPYVSMAKDGLLTAFNKLPGFSELTKQRANASILNTYKYAGQNFVIPWQAEITMYEYNVDMLESIGVGAFPSRYSQFLNVCNKLADREKGCIELHLNDAWNERIADYYLHYLAATGGTTLIDKRRASFNTPTGLAVMKFLLEAYQRSYKFTAVGDAFTMGQVLTKRWGQAAIDTFNEAGFRWEVASPPVPDNYSGPEPPFTFINMKHIVMPYNAKNPQAAWQFFRFMVQDENDRILLGSGRFPARTDLGSNGAFADWFRKYPLARKFAANMENGRDLDQVPNLVEIFQAFGTQFIKCMQGQIAPETAIEEAAKAVNRLLF